MFLATNEQIDKAKEILTKLKFEFSSESFENPSKYISAFLSLFGFRQVKFL